MNSLTIPPPKPVVLSDNGSAAANWKKFLAQWQNFELATGLDKKPSEVRVATLLSIIGEDGQEKYESFTFDNIEDKKDIDFVI